MFWLKFLPFFSYYFGYVIFGIVTHTQTYQPKHIFEHKVEIAIAIFY
jgi:hypothetical protein